jgi:hypothetical protein
MSMEQRAEMQGRSMRTFGYHKDHEVNGIVGYHKLPLGEHRFEPRTSREVCFGIYRAVHTNCHIPRTFNSAAQGLTCSLLASDSGGSRETFASLTEAAWIAGWELVRILELGTRGT